MKLRVITQQSSSESCKLLADKLTERVGYKVWRSPEIASFSIGVQYGDPRDKLYQYRWMTAHGIPTVEWTTDVAVAKKWNKTNKILARQFLNGQDGSGIVLLDVNHTGTFPAAKVYTKYKEKTHEFRVTIFQDKVLTVLEKRRKTGFAASPLRTTGNGYILCRQNVVEPDGIRELAQRLCYANRSDVKGVDICYNEKTKELFVLEINSAPELGAWMVNNLCDVILNTYNEELSL
jgi:hypothetical protein